METTPPDKEGHSDLPSEFGFVLAPRETDAAPVVTRSSERSRAEPTSAMVTRWRAREGRGIRVVPEIHLEPETERRPEQEIPEPQVSMTTCDRGLEAARQSTETASQCITAGTSEVTAAFTSREITSSLSTANTQTSPDTCHIVFCVALYINLYSHI